MPESATLPVNTSSVPIRNIAIIAHVDHGKTTLVDGMLKQSNVFRDPDAAGVLIMDVNDLERERGITILAKNASVVYAGVKINIIDTPGHADFGGEVERVLNMADGCLLLVDAVEGPMPQTRTVLARALQLRLRPIVVINKIDRTAADPERVLTEVHDLFLDLATDADQLDVPIVYTIARDGRAGLSPDVLGPDLRPLFDTILTEIPPPTTDVDAPFQMQIASLDFDLHRGRIAIGRINRGAIRPGDVLTHAHPDGEVERERVTYLLAFEGLGRRESDVAYAGDIVAVTGFSNARIGATLADSTDAEPLPSISIEEPTLRLTFGVNTSPYAGREGQYSTSRQLRERLFRELETNLSLRVEATDHADVFAVSGRGELHLSILIETMRREGFEFQVSRPEVITKRENSQLLEPFEELIVTATEDALGIIAEVVGERRALMTDMVHDGRGSLRIEYRIPTRGTIGLRNALLTRTRGEASMATSLIGFEPWCGEIPLSRAGALVATETGIALSFGIAGAQERGATFVEPGDEVYEGMIVGQHPRQGDLGVNVCRAKKLSNMRSSNQDIMVRLTPAVVLSLEQALDFLADDELLEVTPKHLRLRKRLLRDHERSRARKQESQANARAQAAVSG